ncbi:MAG: CPBP family intramembrane metalloprotease [Candidatus Aenigmarchaeota archaeon]|nr:CPBP family intramembrane metalloprotease [Candidatus Aenigmarchaeota archaeon]NIP40306.1 CPBP family intramembrane metalloprotease [Candidatus Aenigmarchaeota archaeon]NIQ17798.1 CPBP family intramembrane metalloprotease [Candidatus Aenigmarchaeota archaeon]NIS73181.1 CPBP family intramembrane metalloprotease [Candidatus Aenigmarchaeota archaeon]
MGIQNFIKRHPVTVYFILTFLISWGILLLAIGGPGGVVSVNEQFETMLPMMILAVLAGPSIAGILLTGLFDGRTGLREFRSRLLKWRFGVRWYAVALLFAPFLFVVLLLVLSLLSPEFLPGIFAAGDKTSHLMMGLMTGLMAGIFEEIGWTGFATPRLRKRYGILATGLIVGIVWAAWHLLPAFWLGFASGNISGAISFFSYLIDPFLFLVASRVLIVWVYDRTGGSLFAGMLMHVSLTASTRIFMPLVIAGAQLIIFDVTWAAVVWAILAVLVMSNRFRNGGLEKNIPRA